jgi:predicted PurR-regulated permease PerM
MAEEKFDGHYSDTQRAIFSTSIETTLRVAIVFFILYLCVTTIEPFLIPILWGLIIAVSLYPIHRWICSKTGERKKQTSFWMTIIALLALFYPSITFSSRVIQSLTALSDKIKTGENIVPEPIKSVQEWPFIGNKVYYIWEKSFIDLKAVLVEFEPKVNAFLETVLASAGNMSIGFFQFIAAIIIAGFVMANASACAAFATRLMIRLAGEKGEHYTRISGQIISGVTRGILGVSVLQSALALVGFVLMDIPGAELWALACLVLAIVQIGAIHIVVGIGIYVVATHDNTMIGVLFLVWSIALGLLDNFLKPLVMGQGIDVPTIVIFLGAVGGFMASGIIGLFTGAVILVIGYSLFTAWMVQGDQPPPEQAD